jgi:glycerol dehydrogenase
MAVAAAAAPPTLSIFAGPERYVQGRDATAQLGAQMAKLGLEGPALIVASNSARRLLEDTWKASLNGVGIEPIITPFGGECCEFFCCCFAADDDGGGVLCVRGGGRGGAERRDALFA